jgi:hypothetical protein
MRINKPAEFKLNQRALIYIGGMDALQAWPPNVMFDYLSNRIKEVEQVYIDDGDHNLSGCEEEVTQRAIHWALKWSLA